MIRVGILTPHAAVGPEAEFPQMAGARLVTRVVRVTSDRHVDGNGGPASTTALRAATDPPLFEEAVRKLGAGEVDLIGYASTTSAYVIGFDAEQELMAKLSRFARVPAVSTCASAVLALRVLEVERVALIGAPWFSPELNELACIYFQAQGLDVVSSASAQLASDLQEIDPAAFCEWASRHVSDEAQAIFIGGNGFRVATAIEPLETALDRPVIESNQVLLWNLLAQAGNTCSTIDHFGRLFSHRPPMPGTEPVRG